MAECEDVTGRWGQPCPSCGVVLPKDIKARNKDREREREARVHLWRDPDLNWGTLSDERAVRARTSRRWNRDG